MLLVEDHVDSALSVARLLRALGYDVCVAFDGIEALRCAAEFRPEAAFIDLSLPHLDGFSVAERLRAMSETRDARLIAMTGWATDECAALARNAGFDTASREAVVHRNAYCRVGDRAVLMLQR